MKHLKNLVLHLDINKKSDKKQTKSRQKAGQKEEFKIEYGYNEKICLKALS